MDQRPFYDQLLQEADELENELVVNGNILSAEPGRDGDYGIKARHLQEVNGSLRYLLVRFREEVLRCEKNTQETIESLVLPYLAKLGETELNDDQAIYLRVAETMLMELKAPFIQRIGKIFPRLTGKEAEVANLVRMGYTSRETALVLGITKRAVEFHRDKLREKLGLKKRKMNLKAYLSSL